MSITLKHIRSGWLYEVASASAPTTFAAIDPASVPVYSTTSQVVLRVTADSAQYGATAYIIEGSGGGNTSDLSTVTLSVPGGNGTTRTDYFNLAPGTGTYGTISSTETIDQGHLTSRLSHEQQVELESLVGSVCNYNGSIIRVVESSRTDSKELEEGGMLEGFDVTLTSSRQQWSDLNMRPIVGATLTRGGKKFRVESVVTSDGAFELGLLKKHG